MLELIFKREVVVDRIVCRCMAVVAFILLTALGSFVRIPLPFTPVPITLQTFFVLLSGAFLGANLGALSQASYIGLGLVGLPIFSNAQSGWLYFLGPTGGYLAGFVFAVVFIGRYLKYCRDNFLALLGLLFLGDMILLSCGTFWLYTLLHLSLKQSLWMGFIPFIPGDFLKALFAASLYYKFQTRLREIF